MLPRLEQYSLTELDFLAEHSPAFPRYQNLVAPQDEGESLRRKRHGVWLRAVAATVFKKLSAQEVCLAWSQLADEVLTEAWQICGLAEENATLFGLGKLGARELNLSSDVDLLILADPAAVSNCERKLRIFRKLLSEITEFGFCFRVDFDLRPGGPSSQIVTTPEKFQDHYWSRGETWEKMALVRLRAITGSNALTDSAMEHARHFSYRKFLDFNLIEDLKQVRARIHQEGFDARTGQIHIKLQRGGIRDIELFVQSLQVLHGGKVSRLQTVSTHHALSQIADLKLMPRPDVEKLEKTYWRFRDWENLAQAVEDRQTHFIYDPSPFGDRGWPPIEEILKVMTDVDNTVSELLGPARTIDREIPPEAEQATWLKNLGFKEESIRDVWPQVLNATALSQKTDRDERARRRFLLTMAEALSRTKNDRDLGLSLLCDFIKATRAKASFFATFNREPQLTEDLARLFSFSPYLGSLFTSRPELIDHFVFNAGEPFTADPEKMLDEMAERKFLSEIMGSIRFLKDRDVGSLLSALTNTADEITAHLLASLVKELQAQDIDLLCLGKWGGRELGLKSDLDFIFICDSQPGEAEHKVARRFISRLTNPYRGGSLYEIDLRLRPSGKGGPILTTRQKVLEYLSREADIWERQAYLRARTLSDLKPFLTPSAGPEVTARGLQVLTDIRRKLLKNPGEGRLDLKYGPGGLVDIEFAAQAGILQFRLDGVSTSTSSMISALTQGPWRGGEEIFSHYNELRQMEQWLCLAGQLKNSEISLTQTQFLRCAQFLEVAAGELFSRIQTTMTAADELLKKFDPRQNSASLK